MDQHLNSSQYDNLPVQAVKKVLPAVVSIVISKYIQNLHKQGPLSFLMPPFANPLAPNEAPATQKEKVNVGGGSGFIVHPDGLILTNKHVVFDTDAEYTVITSEGQEYPAKVLARDPVSDIAVVKIEATGLPTVQLGNSKKIELGQTVLAIGNALGMFRNSVSKGIISGLSRSISAALGTDGEMEHLRGMLQTDVAINQGNSGGPLINLDGEAVGINTAIIYGAQNIGFSIPINWAKQDLEDIIKYGRIIKPFLGILYVMLNKKYKNQYNLSRSAGALVIRDHRPNSVAVVAGSPADRAGLKENDIITHVNGAELAEDSDLSEELQKLKVGDTIELTVLRKDETLTLKPVLEERK
ncbi:MAG TPA: trypsin-like peptidase domain-containing protein [Candidatus Paceibacterota bacterium]|nr:trypsin-like peptidase domain-containing protein [Candidatus Paceibacterota bacterium]